jgi:hypothetical protein
VRRFLEIGVRDDALRRRITANLIGDVVFDFDVFRFADDALAQ